MQAARSCHLTSCTEKLSEYRESLKGTLRKLLTRSIPGTRYTRERLRSPARTPRIQLGTPSTRLIQFVSFVRFVSRLTRFSTAPLNNSWRRD